MLYIRRYGFHVIFIVAAFNTLLGALNFRFKRPRIPRLYVRFRSQRSRVYFVRYEQQ